jgi:parallel beta-helix repeat protein
MNIVVLSSSPEPAAVFQTSQLLSTAHPLRVQLLNRSTAQLPLKSLRLNPSTTTQLLNFLFCFLVVCTAHAADLVVDQRNPKASDQNPGTKQKPLKTIQAAASRVKAGDKVTIHAGEYRETVIIKASGTPQAPIVFEAAPNETVVIKGSDVIKGWVRTSPNVWKAKLPPVPPRAGKSDDPSFWRTNDVRQVFIKDGILLDAVHLRPAPVDQLKEGNFFCDIPNDELYIWLKDSDDPNRLTIEASVRGAWLYLWGNNVIIRNLQMRHASTIAIINWPACALNGESIVLENCQLTWGDFEGLSVEGRGNKIVSCTVSCHGNSGINGTGEEHLIENCRLMYNNIDHYDPNWHSGGAKLIPRFNRGRIIHNEFAHNIGPGLWLDDGSSENLIEGNLCHDNEGPGLMVEISAGNRVFNNICFSNRNPLVAEVLRPDPDAAKRGIHNTFVAVRRGAEALAQIPYHAGDGRGIYISSSPSTNVYHNTCYLNEAEGICLEGELRTTGKGEAMSTRDCAALNNIIAYNKGTQLVLRRNDKDKDTHGNKSDYNLLIALGAVFAQAGWDGALTYSLKQWQEHSGFDSHSVQSDPAFVMAAMGDFRLLRISAAARAALPLDEVRQDFFGNARPKDGVSVGACETTAFDYPVSSALQLDGSSRPQ